MNSLRRRDSYGALPLIACLLSTILLPVIALIGVGSAVLPVAAQTASDEELWKQLDSNQSGWLSGKELNGGWVKYDTNADGEVTKAEFIAGRAADTPVDQATQAPKALSEAEKAVEAALFEQLDVSGEGYLDGGELEQGNIKSYDANADGRVTLQEFSAGRAKDRVAKAAKGGASVTQRPPTVGTPQPPARPSPATAPVTAALPATPLRLSPLALKPGCIVGHGVFADGRALPEFDVSAAGFDGESVVNVNGGTFSIGSAMGRNGSYTLQTVDGFTKKKPLNALVTNVTAKAKINYNGKVYTMPLHPVDGKTDIRDAQGNGLWSTNGLSRDFVLKINGLKPGKDEKNGYLRAFAYYGAMLNFKDSDGGGGARLPQATVRPKFPREAQLIVTLTPQGPLLDGSTGQTLKRQISVGSLGEYPGHIFDIPIGVYSVQAQVVNGGMTNPLSVRVNGGAREWSDTATVTFAPSANGGAENDTLEIKL